MLKSKIFFVPDELAKKNPPVQPPVSQKKVLPLSADLLAQVTKERKKNTVAAKPKEIETAAAAAVSVEQEDLKVFESSEHILLGNEALSSLCAVGGKFYNEEFARFMLRLQAAGLVSCHKYNSLHKEITDLYHFKLSTDLFISAGQIVALMGDFYGEKKRRISDAQNMEQAEEYFVKAFETLDQGNRPEMEALLAKIDEENKALQTGMETLKPSAALKSIATKQNISYGYITRYYKFPLMFLLGNRYWHLAKYNFDHFGSDARLAFEAGYRAALKEVQKAREQSGEEQLRLLARAFKILFASFHFLTDLYAAGHARTPRRAIYDHVIGSTKAPGKVTVAGFLAKVMHDEDGQQGVVLERDDLEKPGEKRQWLAYGDSCCFEKVNEENLEAALEVLRACLQDIMRAFHGEGITPEKCRQYIPLASETQKFFPLFNEQGHVRESIDDPRCERYQSDWSPVQTLMLLWTRSIREAGGELAKDIDRVSRGLTQDLNRFMGLEKGDKVSLIAVSPEEYDLEVARARLTCI